MSGSRPKYKHAQRSVRTQSGPAEQLQRQSSKSNSAIYEICPLLRATTDIRILTIWPNENPSALIECRLSIWNGEDEYEALSYHWGHEDETSSIRVTVKDAPTTFHVRPNVEAALRQLRWGDEERNLWIDAICINQNDRNEKNHQVAMMAQIFKKADNVCVWLGNMEKNSQMAFAFISRMLNLSDWDRLARNEDAVDEFEAFIDLISRPWFGRRWVVQEIALARRATIHCGDDTVSWKDLADAVALLVDVETRTKSITKLFQQSTRRGNPPNFLGDVRFIGASRLVAATSNLFRKSDDGDVLTYLVSLDSLVSSLTTFKASDPRDTVYAVLSLARDTSSIAESNVHELGDEDFGKLSEGAKKVVMKLGELIGGRKRFIVDYKKSEFEVFKDFVAFTIEGTQSLDIICRPWAPVEVEKNKLPSWIQNLRNAPFGPRGDGRYNRINADPLVGRLELGKKNYSASGTTKARCSFPSDPGSKSLHVTGFVLDEVGRTETEGLGGNISPNWLEFGGWTDRTAAPPEELWRTLVADRGPNGLNPPDYYQLACRYAFGQGVPGAVLNPEQLINEGISSVGEEFLRRMETVVCNRRLISTVRSNNLGLAPAPTRAGDLICILYGCSVPVVLRPVVRPNVYTFVGECYIHGMMDGEALGEVDLVEAKREFELC